MSRTRAAYGMTMGVQKVAAAWLAWTVGCAEPLTADLGVLMGPKDASTDMDVVDLDAPALATQDATSDTASRAREGDATCVTLPDLAVIFPSGVVGSAELLSYPLTEQPSCLSAFPDGGSNKVYFSPDGKPLVRRDQQYAFHWSANSAMRKMQLFGGDDPCPREAIVDRALIDGGQGLGFFPGCQSFVSALTASRVMVPDDIAQRVILGINAFVLCEGACP